MPPIKPLVVPPERMSNSVKTWAESESGKMVCQKKRALHTEKRDNCTAEKTLQTVADRPTRTL